MQITKVYCDKCGTELSPLGKHSEITIDGISCDIELEDKTVRVTFNKEPFVLCKDCAQFYAKVFWQNKYAVLQDKR